MALTVILSVSPRSSLIISPRHCLAKVSLLPVIPQAERSGGPGEGRFYNAYTETMTVEQFKDLTGEAIKLPGGLPAVKVLWGEAYILKLDSNKDTIAKIDAGIYSFVSIGFKAPMLK